MRCEEIEVYLSGLIDDQLPQQQRQAVELHLDDCAPCDEICKSMRRNREELRMLTDPVLLKRDADRVYRAVFQRGLGTAGWLLAGAGALLLLGLGIYEFIIEPEGHLIEKLGVGALAVGGVLLLAGKLVERIRERRTDRYRDVQK